MKFHHVVALCLLAVLIVACTSTEVKRGDYVLVTYAGTYPNGTLFDTNDPALKAAFPAPVDHFTSLPVLVGAGQVVPGFENALLGMKEGDQKTVRIKSVDAYGGYDPAKTFTVPKQVVMPREITMPRSVPAPRAELEQAFGDQLEEGFTFDSQNFRYRVEGLNSTHALLYIINATQDPVQIEDLPWNSTLVRTNPQNMTYRHDAVEGQQYSTITGPYTAHLNKTDVILDTIFEVGQQFSTGQGIVRVVRESDQMITLDYNHPLAGQDLVFNITVTSIQERK